jgi:hypothetical protein
MNSIQLCLIIIHIDANHSFEHNDFYGDFQKLHVSIENDPNGAFFYKILKKSKVKYFYFGDLSNIKVYMIQ